MSDDDSLNLVFRIEYTGPLSLNDFKKLREIFKNKESLSEHRIVFPHTLDCPNCLASLSIDVVDDGKLAVKLPSFQASKLLEHRT